MYELACTHTTTHIRTRVHTHTYAYKHEHTQTHTNVHTHAHTNPPTHTHTHHSYVYIRVHILTCIHIWIIHIYSHTLHTQEYTPFKGLGKLLHRMVSEVKSLIRLKIAEDDLQQKAVEFCDARRSENSKESPLETHHLNQIAGMFGCVDADDLVKHLGLAWNMGPSDVRNYLIFITNEVDSLAAIEQVVQMSDSDVAAFKLWYRKFLSGSIPSRIRGQKPPTSHRFTSNTEIDAHHDRDAAVAAKCLKWPGPILKLSRTNLTAPVSMTSGASIDELSEISL